MVSRCGSLIPGVSGLWHTLLYSSVLLNWYISVSHIALVANPVVWVPPSQDVINIADDCSNRTANIGVMTKVNIVGDIVTDVLYFLLRVVETGFNRYTIFRGMTNAKT